jgi:hypothetical protein
VGDLEAERRVVRHDRRVGRREQQRVAVLVLQPLAVQRGAAGGRAEQEAAAEHVGERPGGVAGALEAEHRVEDVERDHRLAVRGVRRARRRHRRHRPGLGDPLVQDLAGLGLLVRQQQLAVDRVVRLAVRAVDLGRREDRVEAERARLVRDDRHEPVPICLSFMRSLSSRTTAIVVATACLPEPAPQPVVRLLAGQLERLRPAAPALGDVAAELAPALLQVADLLRVGPGW